MGNCNLLRALIKHGADVHAGDIDGNMALHIAAIKNESGAFPHLIQSGAKINAQNRFNLTPFHYAAQSEYNGKMTLQKLVAALSINVSTHQFLELPLDIYFSQAKDCSHLNPLILSSLGTALIERLEKVSNAELLEIAETLKEKSAVARAHILSCMALATVTLYDQDTNETDGVGERLIRLVKTATLTNEDKRLFIEELSKVDGDGVKPLLEQSVVGRISLLGNMDQYIRLPLITKELLKTLGWLDSDRFKVLNK